MVFGLYAQSGWFVAPVRLLLLLSFAIVFAAVPTHMLWLDRLKDLAGGEV